jgi:hypothetical protein
VCDTGITTQGFVFSRQVLYCLSHSSSPVQVFDYNFSPIFLFVDHSLVDLLKLFIYIKQTRLV